MNCLVTGATGFTGYWLSRKLLALGHSVITIIPEQICSSFFARSGLDRRVVCCPGSVSDYDFLVRTIDEHGIDTVFHLAAIAVEGKAHEDPRTAFEVNVTGTYNILDACRRYPELVKRVIVASSDKVYGDSTDLPYREELPVQGLNPYDTSKSCADLIARSYARTYGVPVGVARFANIYGGADLNWSRLIPGSIRRIMNNQPPLLRKSPEDVYKRDFLYIDDQVDAYITLMANLHRSDVAGEAFNFGGSECIPIDQVVFKLRSLLRRDDIAPIWIISDHREILHQQLSSQKSANLLGWRSKVAIDEGLSRTVKWYEDHAQFWN